MLNSTSIHPTQLKKIINTYKQCSSVTCTALMTFLSKRLSVFDKFYWKKTIIKFIGQVLIAENSLAYHTYSLHQAIIILINFLSSIKLIYTILWNYLINFWRIHAAQQVIEIIFMPCSIPSIFFWFFFTPSLSTESIQFKYSTQ
jgi:hypothetical protein